MSLNTITSITKDPNSFHPAVGYSYKVELKGCLDQNVRDEDLLEFYPEWRKEVEKNGHNADVKVLVDLDYRVN